MRKSFTQPDQWVWGSFRNADGATIRTGHLATHAAPLGNIVLLTGLSEFSEKYFETARALSGMGYNVYTMDWRGQGGSERYLSDKFKRHSAGFDHDARDLTQFVRTCVPETAPRAVMCHSKGVLPVMLSIRDDPGLFKAAILCSPFLGFENPIAKGIGERILATRPFKESWMKNYIPGGGPWRPRSEPEKYSSDPVRMHLHDVWMKASPALQIGDITMEFVVRAAQAMMALRRKGTLESIKIPVLVFTAEHETIVNNAATFKAISRLPQAEHHHVTDGRHELLMERAGIRGPVLKKTSLFLKNHL